MAEVGESALNAIVAPGWVLTGKAENELDHFGRRWRTAGLRAAFRVVPLLGDKLSVPTEDGVGRENGTDFSKQLAAKNLALDGEAPPLIIAEANPFLAKALPEDLNLRLLKVDDGLLLAIQPAGENGDQELPRVATQRS